MAYRRPGFQSAVGRIVSVAVLMALAAGGCADSASPGSPDTSVSIDPPRSSTVPTGTATSAAGDAALDQTLANGLRVRMRPGAQADAVAVMVVYDVGERHDPAGASGLAHFAEHIYVTAKTSTAEARSVDQFAADHPLGWNAQTTGTFTLFATIVTPERLADELADAAARMAGVDATIDLVERERARILVETTNMFGGLPLLAAQNLAKEAILPQPNGGRRGGVPEQLSDIDQEQLQRHLDTFYKPNNASLVVAGAFEPGSTSTQITELFSTIDPGDPVPPAAPLTATAVGPTDVEVIAASSEPAGNERVAFGIALPPGSDPRYPGVLVALLRLFAASAQGSLEVGYAMLEDPTVLAVSTVLEPDESTDAATARLHELILAAVQGPLRPGEGEVARSQLGPLLGLVDYPDEVASLDPYQPALTAAVGRAVVPDPGAVSAALASLSASDYAEAAALFAPDRVASVVVRIDAG